MTYEKATALLIGNPHLLDQIGTIVVDEVQMIADPSRGANLEFLLTLLRIRRGDESSPQVIGLSAVVGDTNGWSDGSVRACFGGRSVPFRWKKVSLRPTAGSVTSTRTMATSEAGHAYSLSSAKGQART